MRRGFTLIELMVVVALTSTLAGATGLLYLEVRAAGIQTEAQVALERRAALVLEWVARDLRSGQLVEAKEAIRIQSAQEEIHYQLQGRKLSRTIGNRQRILSRFAEKLSVKEVAQGHRVTLRLTRPFHRGRRLTIQRSVFVGARK